MESDEEMDENVRNDPKQDPDIDTSMWLPVPRKLNFSPLPEDKNFVSFSNVNNTSSPIKISPPCRNLLTLRLTENPSTPSTIYLNSGRRIIQTNKLTGRLSAPNMNPFTPESMLRLSKKRSRCLSRDRYFIFFYFYFTFMVVQPDQKKKKKIKIHFLFFVVAKAYQKIRTC